MKQIHIKILASILSFVILLLLSGCGSSGTVSNDQLVDGTPVCDTGVGLQFQQQPDLIERSDQPMVSDYGELIARGDTFTIPGDGSVTHIGSIEWWGWYKVIGNMNFLDDFTLEIYEFDNGVPKTQPLYSIHIGDIIENAVFTRDGEMRGSTGTNSYWTLNTNLTDQGSIHIHRYEALFTNNPIELESGKQYLLSIVNNGSDGGLYLFNDPNPPTFIKDPGMINLPWSWARADHELNDQSSSWERNTANTVWSEISTVPGNPTDPYNPDLAFSLYDCAGNVNPIVYLQGDSVYRISNLLIDDKEYNIKFKWGTGSSMHGDLEFKDDVDAATMASDAINALLNTQLPTPPVATASTNNTSFPHNQGSYKVPWFVEHGEAVVVENIGPDEHFPNAPAPWFRGSIDAFVPAATSVMYADFILLGTVTP